MGRTYQARLMILPVALSLFFTACSSGRRVQPPPVFDPHKEQISILQKQLLELQNQQNETQRKIDAQAAALNDLNARVGAMESQRVVPRTVQTPAPPPPSDGDVSAAPSRKAAPAKKKATKKRTTKRKKTR